MADGAPAVREKTLFSDQKLTMSAAPVAGGKKRPTMRFDIYKNNPQINVYTNVEGDKDKGVIRAGMDISTFHQVLRCVKLCAEAQAPIKYMIENFSRGKDKDMRRVSKTVIGRDEKHVFLSVISDDDSRPKIKFAFTPSYYHKLSIVGGDPMSDIESSAIVALSWVDYMSKLMPQLLADHYTPDEPYDWKNKDKGNGSQRQQQNAPVQSATSSSFDDFDID